MWLIAGSPQTTLCTGKCLHTNFMDDKEPEDIMPIIPVWLKSQYNNLTDIEKEKYNTFSVIDQKMDWQIKKMREAIDHRIHINQEVSNLKVEVKPAVRLASIVMSIWGVAIAILTLIGVPLLIEWIKIKIK